MIFSQTSDFTEILAHVKEQFAAELVEEKIARHMNSYVRLEKNPCHPCSSPGNKEIFPYAGSKPRLQKHYGCLFQYWDSSFSKGV